MSGWHGSFPPMPLPQNKYTISIVVTSVIHFRTDDLIVCQANSGKSIRE